MNLAPGRQRRAIADFFARWRGAAAIRRARSLRACLLRLFFAVGTAALAADAVVLPRGTVSAGVVRGEVVLVTGAGRVPLARGAAVPVGAAVVTASASSAQLRLSDGAVVSLGADSELAVQEFFQEPVAGPLRAGDLIQEPSVAHVKLLLLRGEVLGRVPRLRTAEGSRFAVATPAGELVVQPAAARPAVVTSTTPLAEATLAAFQAHGLRVGAGDGATVFRVAFKRTAPRRATLELGNGGGGLALVVRGATIAVPDQRELTLDVNLPR